MKKFVKEGPDSKGRTYIIEGKEKPGKVFSIDRFICEIVEQETEEKTQELADFLLEKLNS